MRPPTARAANVAELELIVDAHERYAYRFPGDRVRTVTRALPAGDDGVVVEGRRVASVEGKSLANLVSTLTAGKLDFALADLAALPRAALVVEDRYSQIFKVAHVRPAMVLDGLAELQVRWPDVPTVFLRDPGVGGGVDLPVPGRRLHVGAGRGRLGRAPRCHRDRHRGCTRCTARPRAHDGRGPSLGPQPKHRRAAQRPAAPRGLGRLAAPRQTARRSRPGAQG